MPISADQINNLQLLAAKLDHCAQHGGTVTLNQSECAAIQEALLLAAVETARRVKLRENAGRPLSNTDNSKSLYQRLRRERLTAISLPVLPSHPRQQYYTVRTRDDAHSALVLASTSAQAQREMAAQWGVKLGATATLSRPDLNNGRSAGSV